MLTPTDKDKSCIFNIIPQTCTNKTIQRDTLKDTIDTSKWNSKECSSNWLEGRKKNTDKWETEGIIRKQKLKWWT